MAGHHVTSAFCLVRLASPFGSSRIAEIDKNLPRADSLSQPDKRYFTPATTRSPRKSGWLLPSGLSVFLNRAPLSSFGAYAMPCSIQRLDAQRHFCHTNAHARDPAAKTVKTAETPMRHPSPLPFGSCDSFDLGASRADGGFVDLRVDYEILAGPMRLTVALVQTDPAEVGENLKGGIHVLGLFWPHEARCAAELAGVDLLWLVLEYPLGDYRRVPLRLWQGCLCKHALQGDAHPVVNDVECGA